MKKTFLAQSILLSVVFLMSFSIDSAVASMTSATASPVDSWNLVDGATYLPTQSISYTINWSYPKQKNGIGVYMERKIDNGSFVAFDMDCINRSPAFAGETCATPTNPPSVSNFSVGPLSVGTHTISVRITTFPNCITCKIPLEPVRVWNYSITIYVAAASCTGTTPSNATLCSGDSTGLSTSVARTVVNSCTAATKCEYTCNTGYVKSGSVCVIQPSLPTVVNPTATSITTTGATLGANVTSDGGASLIERGTCWGTTTDPTTNCIAEGGLTTGVFTHVRTAMAPGTIIYYRGYARNSVGTGYSPSGSFTTSNLSPSATISGDGCAIGLGNNTCDDVITWNIRNALTANPNIYNSTTFTQYPAVSDLVNHTTTVSLDFGQNIIQARDDLNPLASITLDAVCVTGTFWDGGMCGELPQITINTIPDIIRSGKTSEVNIEAVSNYDLTCNIYGSQAIPQTIYYKSVNDIFTDHITGSVPNVMPISTRELKSDQVITVICSVDIDPSVTVTEESRIEVIGNPMEV